MSTDTISRVDISALRASLIDDGYCIVKNVVPTAMLIELRETSDRLIAAMTDEQRAAHVSTGSLIGVQDDPYFAQLISLPRALDLLAELGYPSPKFTSGYVISKPPGSPRLFWHYDWAGWDDPGAFGDIPQQLFLMYYLTDTNRRNGCLRVLPGSHKHHHPLLDRLSEAHTTDLQSATDLTRPEFGDADGEMDVCVRAGDLVIGDSRILHSSHANESHANRTVITLWYHPDMEALSEGTQAFVARMWFSPTNWPSDRRELVAPLRPVYDGEAEALPWNRNRPRGR